MSEYSYKAQAAARDILQRTYEGPEAFLHSLVPFQEDDDIPGANLIMKAWLTIGGRDKLTEMVKFATAHKNEEPFLAVLNWFRDRLLCPGGPAHNMLAEDERAQAWVDANHG